MNFLSFLRSRIRAQFNLGRGLGPFQSPMLRAFVSCYCQRCGRSISEFTLFGNALVVLRGAVEVLCSFCRTGLEFKLYGLHPSNSLPRDQVNRTTDRLSIIGELVTVVQSRRGNLSFYDIVLCLGGELAAFQRYGREPFEGFDYSTRDKARQRFGRPLPGNCAECGALWANEWELATNPSILQQRGHNTGVCRACAFPMAGQWFMRTTYAAECELLTVSPSSTPQPWR